VRLQFDPGDDDPYGAARDALLDELGDWLDVPDSERDGVVSDVGFFLDWRYRHSSGVLDEFTPSEVAEFLLEWCPRRLRGRTNASLHLCFAVGIYADFMAATGRLIGGVDRATRLRRLADDLAPTVLAETRDPTPAVDWADEDDPRLQAAMKEIKEKFGPGSVEAPEPYELPFVYVSPPMADVESAAAAIPLLAKLDALREYLGPDGKQLTDKGNLKRADGRALVELLDTGDEMDPQIGDKTWRTPSTANLPQLNFILDIAKETGVVRVHERRLVPVKAWAARPTLQRAAALFASIVELGPLELRSSGRVALFDELHQLLDDGIVHWLAPLLAPDTVELPFESFLEWAQSVVSRQIAQYWPDEPDLFERFTAHDLSRIFEVLEAAGVVRWTDRLEMIEDYGYRYSTGGTVTLTALGRHLLPDYLDDAGYLLRRVDRVADADCAELIQAMMAAAEPQRQAVLAAWQPDRPAVERARMLTEAIVAGSSAASRMMGFIALHEFDVEVAEPLVRQLLDTEVAGHAALWLIQRGRADAETLGNFVDVAVLVDLLSSAVEAPEELCGLFAGVPEPLRLLDNMWRHPAPETVLVLDALGRHLPDRTLAKAARKAAVRHRSWKANSG
jgi:hypothetical protein